MSCTLAESTRYFRGDAAFANPDIYRLLEMKYYFYAMRLKGNNILQSHIEYLLTRPEGRPPKKPIVWIEMSSEESTQIVMEPTVQSAWARPTLP